MLLVAIFIIADYVGIYLVLDSSAFMLSSISCSLDIRLSKRQPHSSPCASQNRNRTLANRIRKPPNDPEWFWCQECDNGGSFVNWIYYCSCENSTETREIRWSQNEMTMMMELIIFKMASRERTTAQQSHVCAGDNRYLCHEPQRKSKKKKSWFSLLLFYFMREWFIYEFFVRFIYIVCLTHALSRRFVFRFLLLREWYCWARLKPSFPHTAFHFLFLLSLRKKFSLLCSTLPLCLWVWVVSASSVFSVSVYLSFEFCENRVWQL